MTANNKPVLKNCLEPCAVERSIRLIGGKWTASILWHLKDGPVRFNELSRILSGASKKMIDQRLKELEKHNMVTRHVISTRPIAVSYELTEFGCTTLGIIKQLKEWAERYNV